MLDLFRRVGYKRTMTEFEKKLLDLLDRIEVQEDHTLARMRFDIAEEYGYTVEMTGVIVSGMMN